MQRIRHVKNDHVIYGQWIKDRKCFVLKTDPHGPTFDSLTAFEIYHLEQINLEIKGGGNGWRNCEVEKSDGSWVKASCYFEDKQ